MKFGESIFSLKYKKSSAFLIKYGRLILFVNSYLDFLLFIDSKIVFLEPYEELFKDKIELKCVKDASSTLI